jgi:hypothetical protein
VIDELVEAHGSPLWLVDLDRVRARRWRLVARGESIDDITAGDLAASAVPGIWKESDS